LRAVFGALMITVHSRSRSKLERCWSSGL